MYDTKKLIDLLEELAGFDDAGYDWDLQYCVYCNKEVDHSKKKNFVHDRLCPILRAQKVLIEVGKLDPTFLEE